MAAKIVSGVMAKLLLPTFTEMRDWKAAADAAEEAKQQPLTRASAMLRLGVIP